MTFERATATALRQCEYVKRWFQISSGSPKAKMETRQSVYKSRIVVASVFLFVGFAAIFFFFFFFVDECSWRIFFFFQKMNSDIYIFSVLSIEQLNKIHNQLGKTNALWNDLFFSQTETKKKKKKRKKERKKAFEREKRFFLFGFFMFFFFSIPAPSSLNFIFFRKVTPLIVR